MRVSGCIRVFLGIFITLALIGAGAYAVSRHYIDKYGAIPEKPIFPEEQGVAFAPTQTRAPNPPPGEAAAEGDAVAQPEVVAPPPTAKPAPAGDLAYVIWPEGLIVRSSASLDGEQIGGIEYKREVYLLETSGDQAWQKIKVANGDLEGWVKGGNLEFLQGEPSQTAPSFEEPSSGELGQEELGQENE